MPSQSNKPLFNSERLLEIAPNVYGGSEKCLWRIDFEPNTHDKGYHNQGVHQAVLCSGLLKEGKKMAVPASFIICVDNVDEGFKIYSPDGSSNIQEWRLDDWRHFADTKIVDIGVSASESWIGVCNSDNTLSFWDLADNFTFEKTFKQTKINSKIE